MNIKHRELIEKYIHKMTYLFVNFGDYSQKDTELIIDYGRVIAYTSYLGELVGLYGNKLTKELKEQRPDLLNGDTRFYFGSCRMAGEYISLDTPEVIDRVLRGVVREKDEYIKENGKTTQSNGLKKPFFSSVTNTYSLVKYGV